MKKLLIIPVLMVFLAQFSCDEVNENDGKTRIIQDSLVNVLPTWQALKITVNKDRTNISVVVGDATFYKASPEKKTEKAAELGKMILRIYGKDCLLRTGDLVVTADITNRSFAPPDGISTPIDLQGLKKVVYPE